MYNVWKNKNAPHKNFRARPSSSITPPHQNPASAPGYKDHSGGGGGGGGGGGRGSYSPATFDIGGGGGGGGSAPSLFGPIFMNKIISMELLTDSARSKIAASRKELIPIYLSVFGTESAYYIDNLWS